VGGIEKEIAKLGQKEGEKVERKGRDYWGKEKCQE
jgi:hypothetical protein